MRVLSILLAILLAMVCVSPAYAITLTPAANPNPLTAGNTINLKGLAQLASGSWPGSMTMSILYTGVTQVSVNCGGLQFNAATPVIQEWNVLMPSNWPAGIYTFKEEVFDANGTSQGSASTTFQVTH
jgi:hypothetical protein